MFKEKFDMLLEKDEDIVWCQGVNISGLYLQELF